MRNVGKTIADRFDIEIDYAKRIGNAINEGLEPLAMPISVLCMVLLTIIFLAPLWYPALHG